MVNYTYDAWGNVLSVTNAYGNEITTANHYALENPFRYRGYFYDTETGFYYCNSRYYDPAMRRFINADWYVSTGQGFGGFNMYTYCGNNPVMYCDPSGYDWVSIRKFVEDRGGTAHWNSYLGIATFELNGITLRTGRWGENMAGFDANNINCRIMADDYELAYYFRVEGWATTFPGFHWYSGKPGDEAAEGFEVDTIYKFSIRDFCLDYAENIIEIAGTKGKYLGKDKYGLAMECFSHAIGKFVADKVIRPSFANLAYSDNIITDYIMYFCDSSDAIGYTGPEGKDWAYFMVWSYYGLLGY